MLTTSTHIDTGSVRPAWRAFLSNVKRGDVSPHFGFCVGNRRVSLPFSLSAPAFAACGHPTHLNIHPLHRRILKPPRPRRLRQDAAPRGHRHRSFSLLQNVHACPSETRAAPAAAAPAPRPLVYEHCKRQSSGVCYAFIWIGLMGWCWTGCLSFCTLSRTPPSYSSSSFLLLCTERGQQWKQWQWFLLLLLFLVVEAKFGTPNHRGPGHC